MNLRLSGKLNLALLVTISVVLGFQASNRLHREEALFEVEMGRDHRVMGTALGLAIEDEWEDSGPEAARALVGRLDARQEVRIRYVQTGVDARLPELPDVRLDGGIISRVDERESPGWFVTYVPLRLPNETNAAIEIRESLDSQQAYVSTTRLRVFAWYCTLVASLSAIVGLLVHWLVARPVRSLIAHGRRVASGDFGSRVLLHGTDELGDLGRELDHMAEHLALARDRVHAEQEARQRAVDQLRHADRLMSIGKLAAGVAHELGTPLNIILVRASSIAEGEVIEPASIQSSAKSIADQSQRMAAIIRQLLDFARPRKLTRAPTDLASLVGATVALLQPTARARAVSLIALPGEAVRAPVDPSQVQQVVLNLLSNALHASRDRGAVRASVTEVTATAPHAAPDAVPKPAQYARITIADDGVGIRAEHLPHVFEPFFTTKDVGEGTGLGLSVSHGIVRDHGGFIEVTSGQGQGATFAVYLPLEASCADGS